MICISVIVFFPDKAMCCCIAYLPNITVIGLYQAFCWTESANTTAGSSPYGEIGNLCQESSRSIEDHSWGKKGTDVRK